MYGRHRMSDLTLFVVDVEVVVIGELDSAQRQRLSDTFGVCEVHDNHHLCSVRLSDSVRSKDDQAASGDVAARVLALLPAGSVIVSTVVGAPGRTAREQHPSNGL